MQKIKTFTIFYRQNPDFDFKFLEFLESILKTLKVLNENLVSETFNNIY